MKWIFATGREVLDLVRNLRPSAIIHAAGQPSHDRAAAIPFDDFETNAVGTLNLLEAARQACPEAPFVHMSTNKVYGDTPNRLGLKELETRWDYLDARYSEGIPETLTIDQSQHSLFGASKLAADILVQEYGRYFDMPTCCLRAGCVTGPNHSGVEWHGFLSYLVKCNLEGREYRIFGFKGKQVRDNIHALDVARFMAQFVETPRPGEVYNLGGGRPNSISILEAFSLAEKLTGIGQSTPTWIPTGSVTISAITRIWGRPERIIPAGISRSRSRRRCARSWKPGGSENWRPRSEHFQSAHLIRDCQEPAPLTGTRRTRSELSRRAAPARKRRRFGASRPALSECLIGSALFPRRPRGRWRG